ncbi:MAG: sugar ABC transporter permease [Alicyclobacillus sp.]|nr:sugar ABC transporter permease [Alicyclobacillus sp.]
MKYRQAMLYLAPALIFTAVFFVFPLLFIIYMSFTNWNGLGTPTFIGLANFKYLFSDDSFISSFINTLYWVLFAFVIHIPLALLTAMVLSRKPRGWRFFRAVIVFPNIISTTAVAFLWYFIFNPQIGFLNNVLIHLGLKSWTRSWLSGMHTALPGTMVPFLLYIGFTMLIFFTQISTIPTDYYEAASIDGATTIQQERLITIPLVNNAIVINMLFVAAYCLKMFEYPFIMTNGGPVNASMNLSLYIYEEMVVSQQYGLSMAAGVITLLVGIVIMSMVFIYARWTSKRWA